MVAVFVLVKKTNNITFPKLSQNSKHLFSAGKGLGYREHETSAVQANPSEIAWAGFPWMRTKSLGRQ